MERPQHTRILVVFVDHYKIVVVSSSGPCSDMANFESLPFFPSYELRSRTTETNSSQKSYVTREAFIDVVIRTLGGIEGSFAVKYLQKGLLQYLLLIRGLVESNLLAQMNQHRFWMAKALQLGR